VARRDVETRRHWRRKQARKRPAETSSESSEAELQKSLQQGGERSARLEQDLAAARRDVETQTALSGKGNEQVLRASGRGSGGCRAKAVRCRRSAKGRLSRARSR